MNKLTLKHENLELKKENFLLWKFTEWIGMKEYVYYCPDNRVPSWFDKRNHSLDCNTKELFEIFISDMISKK